VLSIVDGLQLPAIPLPDVAGSDGAVAPSHILNDVPKLNEGVMLGLTVTLNVAESAHCPAVGVNM
jgi:hypothetical protein